MTVPQHHRFITLDAMRGVAAIGVAVFHWRHLYPKEVWWLMSISGHLAVDFFFALSGFVIAFSYKRRLARDMGLGEFTLLRFIRFLPMIWLGSAIGMIVLAWSHADDPVPYLLAALPGLLIIPNMTGPGTSPYPANGPEWTLAYELLVNILYAALVRILRPAYLVAVMIVAGGALIATVGLRGSLNAGVDDVWIGTSRVLFSFSFGVLLYETRERWWSRVPNLPVWSVLLALAVALALPAPRVIRPLYDIAFVFAASPILIMLGSRAAPTPRSRSTAVLLGELSYPIYAIHRPVRDLAKLIAQETGTLIGLAGMIGGLVLLCVCIGAIPIDEALRRALRRRVFRRWNRIVPAPVQANETSYGGQ